MPRPKKNNADYFSHDTGMRHDKKVSAVIEKFSHAGYAVYNKYLEAIGESNDFKLPFDGFNPDLIAADFKTEIGLFNEITKYLIHLRLIQQEGDFIVCNQQKKRLASLLRKRERDRSEVSDTENPQSKVKEIKVNKIIPTELEFLEYCKAFLKEKYLAYEFALKAKYAAFVQNDWQDGNDVPIKNWKTKMLNIIPHLPVDWNKIPMEPNQTSKPSEYKPQSRLGQ